MVKLEQRADGYYILEVKTEHMVLRKGLMDADKPITEISSEPKANGFYLEFRE